MTDTIKIADSILYGRYQQHKDQAKKVASMIEMAMPHVRKLLNIPNGLLFVVRPNGGKYNGDYNERNKRIQVDPRRKNLGTILSTIMHELVHAEQYHTGKLSRSQHFNPPFWNGEAVDNKGTTYEAYRKLPWEVEAFGRQEELAETVAKAISMEYKVKETEQ
jgi:hypothetical protein